MNNNKVTQQEFDILLEERIEKIRNLMSSKGDEYAADTDRMHNFNLAAAINSVSRESAAWGMATKHLVSIIDMLKAAEGGKSFSLQAVDEKFGDLIVYLILIEISIKSNIEKNEAFDEETYLKAGVVDA